METVWKSAKAEVSDGSLRCPQYSSIADINAVVKELESIYTLSKQNENGIHDALLITHQLAEFDTELKNVVRGVQAVALVSSRRMAAASGFS